MGSGDTSNEINRFIDEVHIHPLQDENSMIYKVIKEIHRLYGIEDIPIRSNVIKALGEEVNF